MRAIKFRGKDLDGKWRYGSLVDNVFFYADTKKGVPYIFDVEDVDYDCLADLEDGEGFYEMRPETIGQFTGLKDKNGKEIYEGDIVDNSWCFADKGVVCFGEYQHLDAQIGYKNGDMGFYIKHLGETASIIRPDILYFAANCEVVGNIYDNPELLNKKGDTPMPVLPHKFNVGDTIRMKDSIAWSFTITDICKDSYIGKGFSLKFEAADMDWELVEEKEEE